MSRQQVAHHKRAHNVYSLKKASPKALAQRIKNYYKEKHELYFGSGLPEVHVKDGKPLTERGAKILGVKWPLE
jgi:hypothetical protein